MNLNEFKNTLQNDQPYSNWSPLLRSLWYDGKGNWNQAHDIADGHPAEGAEWVHAYLHRKEGDKWNAGYWYRLAGKPYPNYSLEDEWEELVQWFLAQEAS